MTTTITICDTCKRPGWAEGDMGLTDGERLAQMIEAAARQSDEVVTRRHACLMGCGKGCNVALQAPGKLTYVLGDFRPEQSSAAAIVEYARLHAQSKTGQVPFRQWPAAIKGHFVSRLPALETDAKAGHEAGPA